jgi:dihydrofolate reductase
MSRKVVLYIATSLDGYIAGPGDDLSFLSLADKAGEDYGYGDFIQTIDTVIVGRRTYDKVLSMGVPFPHTDKRCYIITRTPRPDEGSLVFYTGDLKELVLRLKEEEGKDIFVDGGAQVVQALLREGLIDELTISVIPVCLGNGIRLFSEGLPQQALRLQGSTSFDTGLVQLRYTCIAS